MTSDSRERWPLAGTELRGRTMTARQRVAGQLREQILTGVIRDGERLHLDLLAAEFGTSRTPVREACMDLAHDGLVVIAPRSGMTARGLTPAGVVENFAIMEVLSAAAAEWAAARITPAELERVRALAVEVAIALRGDRDAGTANYLFHREINRACKSPRLLAMLGAAGRLIPHSFLDLFPEHLDSTLEEHDALVSALARGDGRAAADVTRLHLRGAAELVSRRAAELGTGTLDTGALDTDALDTDATALRPAGNE